MSSPFLYAKNLAALILSQNKMELYYAYQDMCVLVFTVSLGQQKRCFLWIALGGTEILENMHLIGSLDIV